MLQLRIRNSVLLAFVLLSGSVGTCCGEVISADVLLAEGTVVDGSGSPGVVGDVAIRDGVIVGVGNLDDVGVDAAWTIDCSGLVQMALMACGIDCPRDSDQQMALGRDLYHGEPLVRGDLVFWEGHIGFMANERMLLHANAHHMAVAYEPLKEAAARIEEDGGGSITARRRFLKP